jgi:hypothetical protein
LVKQAACGQGKEVWLYGGWEHRYEEAAVGELVTKVEKVEKVEKVKW